MPTRRRFLSIVAACAAPAPGAARAIGEPAFAARVDATPSTTHWRGVAMGALASMTLVHPDRAHARALIARCVDEIARLEAIFSLHRADSALSRLNARGSLDAPPIELVELLAFSLALARRSGGAFDPSVQPLYRLHAEHFATPGADPRGPAPRAVAHALRAVGHGAIDVRAGRIALHRPGMALTLNGVAQGFVTDRVAAMLRAAGFGDVLIDLGEARALGERPGGGPWRAAVADPRDPARTVLDLPLGDARGAFAALATSGGYGAPFGTDPRVHHLLDPRTGRSANRHLSMSVVAASATLADGLSTALSILPAPAGAALLAQWPGARAWRVDPAGRLHAVDAPGATA